MDVSLFWRDNEIEGRGFRAPVAYVSMSEKHKQV